MTIKAFALSDRAAGLQAAPTEREWASDYTDLHDNTAWQRVNGIGWQLSCPAAFEATWNGGPNADDVEIRYDRSPNPGPGFVQSQLGGGMLSFHTGYQMQSTNGRMLWVRGPINAPKEGLYPLECLADTSILPCTILVHWRFIGPHQTVRFEAGEPFGTVVPYTMGDPAQGLPEVIPVPKDAEAYEQAFEQLARNPGVQDVVQRLSAGEAGATAAETPARPIEVRAAPSVWATRLSDPPAVSCICPTYGRVDLLEEAIHSFLLQDYPGPKELIVLNDYDRQTLAFDHPDVHVVNVPGRFHSIGEKYKAAVSLASHDLIFVWHDDDIYLPHRLSYSVAHLVERRGFFKTDRSWFWNDGQLSGPEYNVFHGASCWTRALFLEAQGYPHLDNGYDGGFEWRCEEARPGATASHRAIPEYVYHIYRWAGTGSYHLSAFGQTGREIEQVAAHVRQQADEGQVRLGLITLDPHWTSDYVALALDFLSSGCATQAAEEIPFRLRSSLFRLPRQWPRQRLHACSGARTRRA